MSTCVNQSENRGKRLSKLARGVGVEFAKIRTSDPMHWLRRIIDRMVDVVLGKKDGYTIGGWALADENVVLPSDNVSLTIDRVNNVDASHEIRRNCHDGADGGAT